MRVAELFNGFNDFFVTHITSNETLERKLYFTLFLVSEIQSRIRGESKLGGLP